MYPDLFQGISSIATDLQVYINSWDMKLELTYANQWLIMSKAPEYLESTLPTKVSSDISSSSLNLNDDDNNNNINCSLNDSILTTEWPSLFDMIPSPPITTMNPARDETTSSLTSSSTLTPSFLSTIFAINDTSNKPTNPTNPSNTTPSKEMNRLIFSSTTTNTSNTMATSLLEQSLNLSQPLLESPFTSPSKHKDLLLFVD